MSAAMARQGGRVQLEQSDMHLALNISKIAKEGFSRAAIEETKYVIKKLRAEVWEEKKRGVEFPGHYTVKAAEQRHPAMLRHNQTSGWLLCHNGTTKNPETRSRCKGTGSPPLARRRVRTREPTTHPPGTPPTPPTRPAPTGNTFSAQTSEVVKLLAGYSYSHTALSDAEFVEDDGDADHHSDFDPDMLSDEG